jgi:hypothetical protein
VTLSKFDEAEEGAGWLFQEMDDSKKTALHKSVDW